MKLNIFSSPYVIGLTLLLIANVCFYDLETIKIYQIMTIMGVLIIFGRSMIDKSFYQNIKHRCIKYLIVLYLLYTIYGLYFLRTGDYNDDMLIFTCVQNIAIYFCLISFFNHDNWIDYLIIPFILSATFIILYIFSVEKNILLSAQLDERIGGELSGNVNTVGYSMGTLSMVLFYFFIKKKNYFVLLVLIVDWLIMLLTGSKKTILIILVELIMAYYYSKNKRKAILWVIILGVGFYYVLFNIPVFYELIGQRVEDMFGTMFGLPNANYSHSTDDREGMINEGFKLWLQVPLFGGGMNYFSYATKIYSNYGYSHCNVTEVLCNFGIMGFLMYYVPYIKNLFTCIKNYKLDRDRYVFGGAWLICSMVLSWCMVQFSDICIAYIPIITSFALLDNKIITNNYIKKKNVKVAASN